MKKHDEILTLSDELFFRRNENIHIHISGEHESYNGVLHSCSFLEINYVISGKGRYEFEGHVYEAVEGDLIVINNFTPFTRTDISEDGSFRFYSLMFNGSILVNGSHSYPYKLLEGSFAFYTLRDRESTPFIFFNFSQAAHSVYGEFFNKMYKEYKSAKAGYNDVMMAYLMLVIINADRLSKTLFGADNKKYRKQAVEYIQNYINKNYQNSNISVSGLADRVYLNPDYLGRIFKKDTGYTISEAIQKKRIERVCLLLTTTNRSIGDIATECGFVDMHFFYKIFKQRMGVLPSQYRESTTTKD